MSACSRCGAVFSCGMADSDGAEPCWCARLPALPADALPPSMDASAADSCLCPACLRLKIESLGKAAG